MLIHSSLGMMLVLEHVTEPVTEHVKCRDGQSNPTTDGRYDGGHCGQCPIIINEQRVAQFLHPETNGQNSNKVH